MRFLSVIVSLCFFTFPKNVKADTLISVINLHQFKLSKKVVHLVDATHGIYFDQVDFLGHTVQKDTLAIKPEDIRFNDVRAVSLMRQGKVRVLMENKEPAFVITYKHLGCPPYSSVGFSLPAGDVFFYRNVAVENNEAILLGTNPDDMKAVKTDTIHYSTIPSYFKWKQESADVTDKRKIEIREYYPFQKGKKLVYENRDIKKTYVLECVGLERYGYPFYYFRDTVSAGSEEFMDLSTGKITSSETSSIKLEGFALGKGFSFYGNDSLAIIEADEVADTNCFNPELNYVVLPAKMAPGDSMVFDNGDVRYVYTYLKREVVKVPGAVFENCIKIKYVVYYQFWAKIGYLWLQKGTGIVMDKNEYGQTIILKGTF